MNDAFNQVLVDLRGYKQELKAKREKAKNHEIVDGKGWDMIDLAHLDGKISGLDASIAALEEL